MYRGPANPKAMENKKLTNTVGQWYDSVASLQVTIELAPKEEKTLIFTLGSSEDKGEARRLVNKYKSLENTDAAFNKTKKLWDGFLSALVVKTPDDAFDFMTNNWLKYQAISGRLWARTAYYQSSGGIGFRDQLQDSLATIPIDNFMARKQIMLHAAHLFIDGTVYHWCHNLTESGAHTNMSDNLLWLVYLTV
ncbi:MAG: glycosyl transferase family 36, partial [Candidatus Omnitrophica bacterium]|nr:glycosyl transferase family 36 [Candidatus Omnitrophota bacterium]